MAGAPPQTPDAGQSQVIAWRSGYGVEPHLQITFVPFVAKCNSCFSVSPCLCVRSPTLLHDRGMHGRNRHLRFSNALLWEG